MQLLWQETPTRTYFCSLPLSAHQPQSITLTKQYEISLTHSIATKGLQLAKIYSLGTLNSTRDRVTRRNVFSGLHFQSPYSLDGWIPLWPISITSSALASLCGRYVGSIISCMLERIVVVFGGKSVLACYLFITAGQLTESQSGLYVAVTGRKRTLALGSYRDLNSYN